MNGKLKFVHKQVAISRKTQLSGIPPFCCIKKILMDLIKKKNSAWEFKVIYSIHKKPTNLHYCKTIQVVTNNFPMKPNFRGNFELVLPMFSTEFAPFKGAFVRVTSRTNIRDSHLLQRIIITHAKMLCFVSIVSERQRYKIQKAQLTGKGVFNIII